MAKVETAKTYDERPLPPIARYRAKLVRVVSKNVRTPFGIGPKFIFIFTLTEYLTRKDGKETWHKVPAQMDNNPLQAVAMTNTSYGNANATLTKLIRMMLGEVADEWQERSSDTDDLLGWTGELVISHDVKPDKTYAVISTLTPEPKWLNPWRDNMTGDKDLVIAQNMPRDPSTGGTGNPYENPDYDPFDA